MYGIGFQELLVILVIALIIFGPSKLPQIGSGLGKAIRDFGKAMRGEGSEERMDEKASKKEKDDPTKQSG
jgi:sec-independent protein translocase protein TatA